MSDRPDARQSSIKKRKKKWRQMQSRGGNKRQRQVRPWGVDVASGVEVPPQLGGKASPGVKDAGKMKAFVRVVRDG